MIIVRWLSKLTLKVGWKVYANSVLYWNFSVSLNLFQNKKFQEEEIEEKIKKNKRKKIKLKKNTFAFLKIVKTYLDHMSLIK